MEQDDVRAVEVANGYRLLRFETIGSTNTEAMRRLKAGDPGRVWLVSREQTAGRGRRGRTWLNSTGNLAVSLGLVLDATPSKAATLGFVAGLALGTALHYLLPKDRFGVVLDGADVMATNTSGDALDSESGSRIGRLALKWPNDVTLAGRKLSGILLEAEQIAPSRLAVVIGIGVNVVSAPEGLPYPVASLKGLGLDIEAEALLVRLIGAWPDLFQTWLEIDGFRSIRQRWLGMAQGLGSEAAVSLGSRVVRGTFETIDDEGRLILRDDEGVRHAIAAGDVHFGVAASARPEE